MTLREIPFNLGYGGAHLNQSVLRDILAELQDRVTDLQTQFVGMVRPESLTSTVVNGAATDTDIAVAGIETGDALAGVVKLDFTLTKPESTGGHRWTA